MSPIRMEKIEAGLRTVIAFNEAFNRHDVAGMMKLVSEDCRFESAFPAPEGTIYTDKEAITRFWQDFFHETPQTRLQVEEVFGLGLRCVLRWRCEWVEAEGRQVYRRGLHLFKFNEGLISEILSYVKG